MLGSLISCYKNISLFLIGILFVRERDLTQSFDSNLKEWKICSAKRQSAELCGSYQIITNARDENSNPPSNCIFERLINLTSIKEDIAAIIITFNIIHIDIWNFETLEVLINENSMRNLTSYTPSSHLEYLCGDALIRDHVQEVKLVLEPEFREGKIRIREQDVVDKFPVWGLSNFKIHVLACPENSSKMKESNRLLECVCNQRYYQDKSFTSLVCLECSFACLQCYNRSQCIKCEDEYYLTPENLCQRKGKREILYLCVFYKWIP